MRRRAGEGERQAAIARSSDPFLSFYFLLALAIPFLKLQQRNFGKYIKLLMYSEHGSAMKPNRTVYIKQ